MDQIIVTHPNWLFVPIFLVIAAYLRTRNSAPRAFSVPGLSAAPATARRSEKVRTAILSIFFWAAVCFLALAASEPRRDLGPVSTAAARNILLALDISRSMSAADFATSSGPTTRMEGVRAVVLEFLKRRPADRIGLVVFGAKAYVQAPLTLDHEFVAELLSGLEVGMAGDGTAIGEGLGAALKRIQELPADSKAVVLVTDGASNAGSVSPLSAANVAKDLGVRVYTIGIGSADPIAIGYPGGIFGNNVVQRVEFDEDTLKQIATVTGGRYQNADSLDGLREVYREIDALEKTEANDQPQHEFEALTALFLWLSIATFLIFWVLRHTVLRVVP